MENSSAVRDWTALAEAEKNSKLTKTAEIRGFPPFLELMM